MDIPITHTQKSNFTYRRWLFLGAFAINVPFSLLKLEYPN